MERRSVMLFVFACFLLISTSLAAMSPHNYEMFDGHKVIRVLPTSIEQLKSLRAIGRTNALLVDFWIEPRSINHPVVMRIAPDQYEQTIDYLKANQLSYEIQIDSLRSFVQQDIKEMAERVVFNVGDHPSRITTNQYHNLTEIYAYLDSIIQTYPEFVSGVVIGTSLLGRPMRAVKVGYAGTKKPAVFIDGCLHAREWLSCATMVYILNELTTNSSQYLNFLNKIDIYVMPVANPDGYDFTWTSNRLWRKTRSGPYNGNCYGVDPNRNFAYQWGVSGISNNPCAETYDGPSPFSEIEMASLARFICSNNDTINSYMNIHTYSEYFMYPFGDVSGHYPANLNTLVCNSDIIYRHHSTFQRALSLQAAQAIRAVNGISFTVGSIYDVLYPASGFSIDHMYAICNVEYSLTMELRPANNAANGFQLPASQIIAGASEAWAGIQVVWNYIASGSTTAKL